MKLPSWTILLSSLLEGDEHTSLVIDETYFAKAVQNEVHFSWVRADSLYGHSNDFRNKMDD